MYNRSTIMIAVVSVLVGVGACDDLAQAQYYSSQSLDPYHRPYGSYYPKEAQIRLTNLDAQLRTQTNLENTETAGGMLSQEPEYAADQDQSKEPPPHLRRQIVDYWTKEAAGTIIIDTANTYLYLVLGNGTAMRYGVGVGREGFTWAGEQRISRVAEWPDWTPPKEMIERQPYLPRFMAGGPTNPMGARALYLGSTVYRIHGTNQPSSIGTFVSSGCIRLTNADIEDLYSRVAVGTRVIVLPLSPTVSASSPQIN